MASASQTYGMDSATQADGTEETGETEETEETHGHQHKLTAQALQPPMLPKPEFLTGSEPPEFEDTEFEGRGRLLS